MFICASAGGDKRGNVDEESVSSAHGKHCMFAVGTKREMLVWMESEQLPYLHWRSRN